MEKYQVWHQMKGVFEPLGMLIIFVIALIVIFAVIGVKIKQKQKKREKQSKKEDHFPEKEKKDYNV